MRVQEPALQDNVPSIRGTNLFQVFCNLIKNAIDAMPQGGALTIGTRIVDREVIVRFEDNGIGPVANPFPFLAYQIERPR